jgi:hypothetical protein
MVGEIEFEEDGRTYTCRLEGPIRAAVARPAAADSGGPWWWFGVSGDPQRYAPFHGAADDTMASVRTRIVTYYADLLVRRATKAGGWLRSPQRTGSSPAVVAATVGDPGTLGLDIKGATG